MIGLVMVQMLLEHFVLVGVMSRRLSRCTILLFHKHHLGLDHFCERTALG